MSTVGPTVDPLIAAYAIAFDAIVHPYGGRAIDLADPGVDWKEIAELVDVSYRMIAP